MNANQANRLAAHSEKRGALMKAYIRAVNKQIRKAAAMGMTIVNFSFDFGNDYPIDGYEQAHLRHLFLKKGYLVYFYESDHDSGLTIIFRKNLKQASDNFVSGFDLNVFDIVKVKGVPYEVLEISEGDEPDSCVCLSALVARQDPKIITKEKRLTFNRLAEYTR